jgi:alpha-mannosidase
LKLFPASLCIAALSLGGIVSTSPALAQNVVQSAIKSLPAPDQQVISTLDELNTLPSGTWRFHAGDVAHGEDPTLDDSSWQVVKPGFVGPYSAGWFRQWVEVPKTLHGYDLTGTRIWFQFRAYANGPMPQIIYFNGRRVALGDDLEPIVLFDKAKPGQKILVAVKLLATVDKKHFAGSIMKIDFAPDRPNPEDLRTQFVSNAILIPSLSKNIPADEATLNQAISTVDLKALDADNQAAFDASLTASQQKLDALRPLMHEATFHETGNSHIDAAWLWPWTETVGVVKDTFGTAIQLMEEYPDYTYTQSAARYNAWLAEKYPALNDQIKKRIKQGRWEVVGGMWVEPDLNLPDGESTARSILIGKRWYLKHYGVDVKIGWNPDSFGYNWQLPQIYKKSGIDYFVTQKMAWNDTNQLPLKLFWWESPDGSKVLTYFPHDYGNTNLSPIRLSADLKVAREYAPGLKDMMDLYGVGDHGGGPTRAMLDQGMHWANSDMAVPKMKFGTAISYFDSVQTQLAPKSPTWDYKTIAEGYHPPTPVPGKIAIPTWDDELYLEFHRGTYTTQAKMKKNLREAPEWTLNAEKLASLAWLDGNSYPNGPLTDAWKKITFNDFHDLAAGSGIAAIYKDAQKDFDVVHWEDNQVAAKATNTLDARINTSGLGVPVLVFNPMAWQRNGLVKVSVQMPRAESTVSVLDSAGHVLPSEVLSSNAQTHTFKLLVDVKDAPSMGYEVLHVVPGKRAFATDLKVSGLTLQNSNILVTVDKKSGCITSLVDKKTGFEALAPGACGNELQLYHDLPKQYDAWNIDPGTYDVPPTRLDTADSVQLIENTPLRAVIRVVHHTAQSKFVQDIILTDGADEVVVKNNVDWHETHELLKAAFPLAASSSEATYEIPFGSIQRPTTRNNSWEKARFEVPAQRWADLGDGQHGFSLINDCKYGYDARGNVLRLTLLRSPTWPDPNADRGHQSFDYALYPHAGTWKQAMTVRHGWDFNYKLHATQVEPHTGEMPARHSFVSVTPDDVVMTAMKKAEDSNALVFHLYEWAGKSGNITISLPPGATGATETNLMETPEGPALSVAGNKVTVPVHPYEIVAVKVDYPHSQD